MKLEAIEKAIKRIEFPETPANLYEPLRYFLSLGGKRIRPQMVLMGYEVFKADWEQALPQALAIELFHNFTLIHDDIMDNAPTRRSRQTVHEKWNRDIAILSGDVLFVQAVSHLAKSKPEHLSDLLTVFNTTAQEVCEGQQMDMDFEELDSVTVDQYIEMIRLKTAVLLGASLKMGGICADASRSNLDLLYDFGMNMGIAFQLQDDYLDAYGDPEQFGKQVGGDIINNKKTFLSIRLRDLSDVGLANQLKQLKDPDEKVAQTIRAYNNLGVREEVHEKIEGYFSQALTCLEAVDASGNKTALYDLANKLFARKV